MAGGLKSADTPPSLATLTDGADWTRVEAGESGGSVWRLVWAGQADAYLKHGRDAVANAIADEAVRLRWLAGRAPVPAVRLFACTADPDWLLTDAAVGRTGDDRLKESPAMLPVIVRGCAALMRALHTLPVDECPFDASHRVRLAAAWRNVAAGLVDEDDFDDDHAGWSAVAMLAETERLASICPARVVTHGDFSLGNILFDEAGEVTGLIDVGRCGVADPYQDIAVLWQNMGEFGLRAQALLVEALSLAVDEPRLTFHRCMDELF